MKELLKELGARFDLALSENQLVQFERYAALLVDWNQRMNLTAVTDAEGIALKHFIDSLLGAKYLPEGVSLCDIGTGAGFPGVPLKIFRPDIDLTLMDSLNKRIGFLKEVVAELRLDRVEEVHIRAEEAGIRPEYRETFDVVTARAVARLNTLCEYALPLVKVGGFFLAYKGVCGEEIDQAGRAMELLGGRLVSAENICLSGDEDRRTLVRIEKIAPTPRKYPRGRNLERTKPIV